MRIEQLRLDRYAMHVGRVLNFPAAPAGQPDLHVIAGPNATGKSSIRAAITDLLYNMPHRSPWAIGYDQNQLKIGAIIASRTGQRLDFNRLKARRITLTDVDDNQIDEGVVQAYLGGVDRKLYEALYALDQDAFREGSEEMLKAGSEVGQTIFAAASGVAALTDIRNALKAELDAIGSERRSDKPVWQAEAAFQEALLRSQNVALGTDEWNSAADALAAATEGLKTLRDALIELEKDRSTIERHLRVLPILPELDRLRREFETVKDAPILANDLEVRWRSARERADATAAELDRAKGVKARKDIARAALPLAARRILDFTAEIEGINREIGKIQSFVRDEGKLRRDVDMATRRLQERVSDLGGRAEEVEVLTDKIPSQATISMIRDLITEHEGLAIAEQLNDRSKKTADLALQTSEESLETFQDAKDPADAAALMHACRSLEADFRKSLKDQVALRKAKETEQAGMAALTGWSEGAEVLLATIFPATSTIAEAKVAIERARQDENSVLQRTSGLKGRIAAANLEIDHSAKHSTIPSGASVIEERSSRDRQWSEIRATAESGQHPKVETLDKYEIHVRTADQLVDRQVEGADMVASQRRLSLDLQRLEVELAHENQVSDEVCGKRQVEEAKVISLWNGSGYLGELGTPDTMLAWLALKDKAIDAVRARMQLETEADESRQAVILGISALHAAANLLGVHLPEDIDNEVAIRAAVARTMGELEKSRQDWAMARKLEDDIRQRRTEAEQASENLAASKQELSDWKGRWASAIPAINLAPDANIAAAKTILGHWESFSADAKGRKEAERRADAIRSDLAAIRAEIDDIVGKVGEIASIENAPDEERWQEWPRILHAELGRARAEADSIGRADREIIEAENDLTKAEESNIAAAKALNKLRQEAGLSESDNVDIATASSRKKQELNAAIGKQIKALTEAAEGLSEEALRNELGSRARQEVEALRTDNELGRKAKQTAIESAIQHQEQRRQHLQALEERSGFSAALHESFGHAGQVGELTRRWMRITVARLLLDATIERYRAQHEGPMIRRANEMFIAIAGNQAPDHFAKLDVDYEKPSDPQLIAIRSSGASAKVNEMSEGTRDQLWLSFRIAALERRAREGEPLPFLADDLFASSDPQRAATGMRYLGELSKSTQVIVFTHHDYVVSAAQLHFPNVNVQHLQR